MTVNYQTLYNQDYFLGKKSFFWKFGYGTSYGVLSQRGFDHVFRPLRPYISGVKEATVLDVGCAYGYLLDRFPNSFRKYGLDVSEYAIRQAQLRNSHAVLRVSNVENSFPFPQNFFDFCICTDVIEHVKHPARVIENVWRALKPGGIFYLTTPNKNWVRSTFLAFADAKEHHISLLPHDSLVLLVQTRGFQVLEKWTFINLIVVYFRFTSNVGIESAVICKK